MRAYSTLKAHGILPDAGGWLDQPRWLTLVFDEIAAELRREEAQRERLRRMTTRSR